MHVAQELLSRALLWAAGHDLSAALTAAEKEQLAALRPELADEGDRFRLLAANAAAL